MAVYRLWRSSSVNTLKVWSMPSMKQVPEASLVLVPAILLLQSGSTVVS